MKFLLNYVGELLQIVYPTVCASCGEKISRNENIICLGCMDSMPFTNYWSIRQNKMERQLQGRFPFEFAFALCHFSKDGAVQTLLHQLKYRGKTEVGIFLGEIMGEKLAASELPKPDALVPLPLHWKKERLRGYNQSNFVAEGISNKTGIPVLKKAIERVKASESQTKKSKFERMDNVEQIFELTEHHQLAGKHILLVDDVLTTGATAEACATELLKAENTKISLATVALTIE